MVINEGLTPAEPGPSQSDRSGNHYDVLIVGGGHAGAQAAIALRQGGFKGTVGLVGDEPDLPYERPSLSKDYLAGDKSFERIMIRQSSFWTQRQIEVLLSRRVRSVDATAHAVTIDDGTALTYGSLIWATGGIARRLVCEGHQFTGVHTVRFRADVDRMIAEMPHISCAVVIGGGFIGLEAAAVLTKSGKRVTIVESQDRVLARVAGEPLSRFYEAEHRAHGVDIRLGAQVDRIEGHAGRVTGVRMHDGTVIPAHMVIVGIGIVPTVEPLLSAGAAGGNGVAVDRQCRTSLPDVFAIGDCALHVNSYADDQQIRLESVQNANDQANVAARTILGQETEYDMVPWFWSNQYDLKMQTVGLSIGYDQAIVRGDPSARSFSVIYLKDGRVIALDCVNAVKDYVQGKALMTNRSRISVRDLTDTRTSLREVESAEANSGATITAS